MTPVGAVQCRWRRPQSILSSSRFSQQTERSSQHNRKLLSMFEPSPRAFSSLTAIVQRSDITALSTMPQTPIPITALSEKCCEHLVIRGEHLCLPCSAEDRTAVSSIGMTRPPFWRTDVTQLILLRKNANFRGNNSNFLPKTPE